MKITSKFNRYQQLRTILNKIKNKKTSVNDSLIKKIHMSGTMSFQSPDGQVESISQESMDGKISLILSQDGLTGALGALPIAYSEWLTERHFRYSDDAPKDFLSLFEHRLYTIDYLVWQSSHLYAYTELKGKHSVFDIIRSLSGFKPSPYDSVEESYAFLFSPSVRSLINLKAWMEHYYETIFTIKPFTGVWKKVEAHEGCVLGANTLQLADAPVVGTVAWDIQSNFTICIGPVLSSYAKNFLPRGKYYDELWFNIRKYVGPVLDFDIVLLISGKDAKSLPLGEGYLGLNMYIGEVLKDTISVINLRSPDQ